MPRRNRSRSRSRSHPRPIVSDIPGAADAITGAFRPELYLKRLKEEAREQQAERKERQSNRSKSRGAHDAENDNDAGNDYTAVGQLQGGPPECIIRATRVLSCPVCSQRIDDDEEAQRQHHPDSHDTPPEYNYDDDDSQFLLDDSQHFEDTEAQIRREAESAARHRRRRVAGAAHHPHACHLGQKSLLIAPSCGHVFCTDCWERETEREGEERGWHGSAAANGAADGGGANAAAAGDRKIPCPLCAAPLHTSRVGRLRVHGEELMGPRSAMGAVLLRGLMMHSAGDGGGGDGNGAGGNGGLTKDDDIRRGAGQLVPGTQWKKIGRKRKSDAYMDMSDNVGVGVADAGTTFGAANIEDTLPNLAGAKKNRGRAVSDGDDDHDHDDEASSATGRQRIIATVAAPLMPIKEESQSQAHSEHDADIEEGGAEGGGPKKPIETDGQDKMMMESEPREQLDMAMDQPSSPANDVADAAADSGENTQMLDQDLFRSIAGGCLGDNAGKEDAGADGIELAEPKTVGATADGAVSTDANESGTRLSIDNYDTKQLKEEAKVEEKRAPDRDSQTTAGSDATAPPAGASSAVSTSGSSSVISKKRKTRPSANSSALEGLLLPKGSRTIDPGVAKRGGRGKRRRTGGGLNMKKIKEEQRRKEKAKTVEEDLSFHGSQSQLSVGGTEDTVGDGDASSENKVSARNELSFGSDPSSSVSQEDEIPVPEDSPAGVGGNHKSDRVARMQRVDAGNESKNSAFAEPSSSADTRAAATTGTNADKNKKSSSVGEVAHAEPGDNVATPGSKRKHKHSIFETYEEVDDDIIEFTGTSGKVEKRRVDRSHEIIPAGTLVRIANRTFPGSNKLGGVAKVKVSRGSVESTTLVYDVVYVLGGRDTNIPYVYVVRNDAFSDDDDSSTTPGKTPGPRRRSTRASRSSTAKSLHSTRPSPRRRSPRIRQDETIDINPAPRYVEVEEHDNGDEDDAQPDDDVQVDPCEQQSQIGVDDAAGTEPNAGYGDESDDETKVDDDPDLTASQQSPALLPSEPSPDRRPRVESTSAPSQLRLDMSVEEHQSEMGGDAEVENQSEIAGDEEEDEDSQTQLPPHPEDSDETAEPKQNEDGADDDEDYDDSQTQGGPCITTNGQIEESSESPRGHFAGTMSAKRSVSTKTPIGTDLRCVAETTRATDKTKRGILASPIAGAARNLDSKFVAFGEHGVTCKDGDDKEGANVNDDDRSMQQYSPDLLKQTPGGSQQKMEFDEHLDSPSQVPATEAQLSPPLLENKQSPGEEGVGRGELDDSCSEVPATEPPGYSQSSPESLSQQSQTFDFSTAAAGDNDEGPSTPSRPKQQLPPRGNHFSPSQESLHSQDPHFNGGEQSEPSEMYFLPSQAPSQGPTNQSPMGMDVAATVEPRNGGGHGGRNSPVASPDRSQGSVDAAGDYSPASPESPEDSLERHLHYLAHGTQTESQTEPSQHKPTKSRFSSLKKPVSDRRGLHVEFDMTAKQTTAKKPRSAMGNPDTPATGYSTTTEASTVLVDNIDNDNDPLPETEEVPATEPPPGYLESQVQRDRSELRVDESQFPATEEVPATLPPPGYYESQVQRDRTELRVDDESQFPADGTEEIPATLPPPGHEESQVQRDRSELRVEESQFQGDIGDQRNEKKRKRDGYDSEAHDSDADEEVPSSVPQSSRYSSSMPMADSEFASLARKAKEGITRRCGGARRQPEPMKLRRVSEAVAKDDFHDENEDDEDGAGADEDGVPMEDSAPAVTPHPAAVIRKKAQSEDEAWNETDNEEGLECELRLPSKDNLLVPGTSSRDGRHTTQASRPLLVFNAESLTDGELSAALRLQDDLGLCDITSVYSNYNDLNPSPDKSLFVVHTRALPVSDAADTPDEVLVCDRSFEYLMALASGWLVVSADWLVNCSRENRWLNPKSFVAWGDYRSYLLLTAHASPSYGGGICRKAPIIRGLIDRENAKGSALASALPLLSGYAVVVVSDDRVQSRPGNEADGFCLTAKQLGQLTLAHGGKVVKTGQEQCWKVPLSSTKRIVLVPNSLERNDEAISTSLTSWLLKQSSIIPETARIELDQSSEVIKEACSTQKSLSCGSQGGTVPTTVLIIRARWLEDSAASLRSVAPLKDYCLGRICWEG